jgi:hypothetical protein
MTERDYASKLAEADRLVNDPEMPMDAALVWRLMDEISDARPEASDGPKGARSKA